MRRYATPQNETHAWSVTRRSSGREVRQGATGSRIKTAAILGIGVVILMVLYATAGMDSTGLTPTIAVITAMALAMQAALTTPNAISSERDAGNWGVLLTTPVTGRQVVMGKVAGAIRRLWLLPALLALHMAVVMVLGWLHPVAALHTVILLGGLVLMLAGTGIFWACSASAASRHRSPTWRYQSLFMWVCRCCWR